LVINSDTFRRKIIESGEDLSLQFPIRGVLLYSSIQYPHRMRDRAAHPL
jgi:hypothetical protein